MQRHVESTARNRKISLQKNEGKGFIFGVNSTGYYRQAIALQCMGRHAEALAAYASALAHDEKSQQLLQALMEASLKSNLQETLEPLFEQLEASDISGKAFATVAIIGQELLASDELQPAITVLESSLQLGTDDLSLKGSVYSALSSAYWKNGNVKRALHFMHQDLLTVESLDDNSGVCRVHGNLGNAYFCQNLLSDAQQHHQMQLDIATQQEDTRQAANALTALGHVFVASGDYENALSHHKRSAVLRQEIGDLLHEAKELANVGAVYALLGDFDNAIKCQEEHLKIVMDLEEHFEICHAMSLLGGLYQRIQKYEQSAKIYQEMFRISQESNDYENQCNALSGLGMAYRLQGKLKMAENCHEQQLKIAIEIQNRSLEAKAQADLGLTYQEKKDFAKALEYQKSYLESCRTIDDREGESRAYGNIGDAYQALEQHERAIKYYKLGLSVAKDVDDHHLEGSLHGKIAASYQALEMVDNALKHHKEYLSIAVELKDLRAECTAECNLGNFYSQQERFEEAVSHYENGSAVANKLQDKAEMCKATHNLAYAYYRLKNYNESIEFYEENISLANDLDDRELLSMAYCNLGLAYLAMNDFEKAVRCQKLFLASAREKKNTVNVCKALGNLGKIYIEMGDVEEGLRFFYEKVKAAEKSKDLALQADCNHELAKVLENEGNIEEAEARFEKELTLRRQIDDKPQQFYQAIYAYASLLEKSEKLEEAHKLYCEVFQHAKQLGNLEQCKTVCQLMGRINMRMEKYDKAIIAFRLQLECISDTVNDSIDSGHVHLDISECYKMVGNHDNAIHHLLQYQQIATVLQLTDEENIAYKKLSDIHIYRGTYQEALMYSEKRLICCQELEKSEICDAYKNVAFVHALLQNYDSAISYYEKLLASARDLKLTHYEYHAYRGLGDSYKLIKEYEKSMHAHQNALDKAVEMENKALQADSYNLLGDAYNKLDNQSNAIQCYKQSLTLSEEIEALDIQMQACGRLGKLYYQCGQNDEALDCFRSAVKYSDELGSQSEQIKALYRLAFGLYLNNDLKMSLLCFQRVVDLVEYVEHKSITSFSTEAIKFIMAAYQMLQKVYVKTGQYKQALFMAEKANSLNLELLLKKAGIDIQVRIPLYEKFLQRLKSLASNVCFYSTVLGQLYCWILSPKDGFVKFWQRTVIENYEDENLRTLDMDDVVNISLDETNKKIDSFIETTRKTLDVEIHEKGLSDRTRSFAANIEVIDRKQNRRSRIGRPVVSNSFDGPNAPAYQFRYRRPNKPDQEKRHSRNYNWFTEAPIEDMYKLFVEEIDDYFNQMKEEGHFKMNNIDLKIIVPRELALIPFPLLRGQSFTKSFSEQYNLSYSPNLFWFLETKSEISSENIEIDPESENVFIFGGGSELVADEARGVAKVFGTAPTTGNSNLKEDIVDRLNKSIVCHLSSDVAWQTPSFVFPCKVITKDAVRSRNFSADPDIEDLEPDSRAGSPGLSDVFITAKDIYEMNLKTSLVMYGISSPSEYTDPICADGLYLLMISLQMAGCKTLITSTWPVADNARRRFFQGFYQQYNKGIPAYEAFQQTVHAMQTSDEFKHPTHWAGFVLYGQNSMLNRQTQSLTKALHEFLDNPNRDAIKVILHLVEKARQRLASDRRTSLYVAESSINKKIAPGTHWKPILAALGFRFEKAQNNLPDAVFFPGMECTDTLNNSSNTLYAFLGLSRNGLEAIAKLRSSPYIGLPLIKMLQEVLYYFNQDMSNVQVPFPLPLWRVPGCHEFLSSVGFELMGIGKTEVMLRSGKITMRRPLQCALQASKDLFEHMEQTEQSDEKHISNGNKSQSESIIKPMSPVSKKNQSENTINYINDSINEMSLSKQRLTQSNENLTNNFLNSDRGLWSSKDSVGNSSSVDGGAARKLRQRNQEATGMKSDMKRYGTMEKLDVSDLVLTEGNTFSDDEGDSGVLDSPSQASSSERGGVASPDIFYGEDVEHFLENFHRQKLKQSPRVAKLSVQSGSSSANYSTPDQRKSGLQTVNTKPRMRSQSEFSDSFLTESGEHMRRIDSISSEDSDHVYQIPRDPPRPKEEDDIFNGEEQTRKTKIPNEWKKLQLTNDYFQNKTLIKTASIRETLSIDSGVHSPSLSDSHKHSRQTSGGFNDLDIDYTDSKRSSPDVDRKSLESSDDLEISKKKGWFTKRRNKKKQKQLSEDDSNSHTLPAAYARQNMKEMKRYSVDALSFLDNTDSRPQQNGNEHGRKGARKSEGDLNLNLKHAVNPQPTQQQQNHLHPAYPTTQNEDGVQMSLC